MYKNLKRFTAIFLLVFSLVVFINFAAIAQDSSDVPSVNIASSQTCSVPSTLRTEQVIDDNGRNSPVKMGDRIRVKVKGLSEAATNATPKFDPRQLVLYLNGYQLKELHGEPVSVIEQGEDQKKTLNNDWLAFQLERTDVSETAWNSLLGGTTKPSINAIVGVGCPGKVAIPVNDPLSLPLLKIVLFSWRFWLCLLLVIAIILIFVRYGRDSLRSPGIEGIYSKKEVIGTEEIMVTEPRKVIRKPRFGTAKFLLGSNEENRNPFSLSISQLAFWTFIIFAAYLIIYGITGDYTNILTRQALVLLGINSVTAFGTSLIDGQGIEKNKKGSQRYSEGFLKDILSDINGVNFHRFQTFIWTVAIGLLFVWEVIKNLAMPEFDDTLLTLQGISSATYLGLRGQEQHGMPTEPTEFTPQEDKSSEQPSASEGDRTPTNTLSS
jgi:hypothetical protein